MGGCSRNQRDGALVKNLRFMSVSRLENGYTKIRAIRKDIRNAGQEDTSNLTLARNPGSQFDSTQ
jgi:hypothetical protein